MSAAADRIQPAAIRALAEQGRTEEALALAEQALAEGHEGRAELLLAQASTLTSGGHFQRALRAAIEAAASFRNADDRGGECDALVAAAATLRAAGDHAGAVTLLEQAETQARSAGDTLRSARVQRQIGVVSSVLGQHQHALSCLADAAQTLRQHAGGDEERTVRLSLLNAGSRRLDTITDLAERQQAAAVELRQWAQLATEAEAAGQTRLALMAWGNHAIVQQPAGQVAEAAAALLALIPRYRAAGMRPNEALAHCELGRCHETLGDAGAAHTHYAAAVALLHDADTADDLLQALEGLARCEEACGDVAAALAALKQVRAVEKRRSDDHARQAITRRELRIELARLTDQWSREATQDPLTGLANRRGFDRWLAERWPLVERGRALSLLLLDLDHFKQVNDRHGHAVGDRVLQAAALLLQDHARASDLAVRYGGEEFLLVLADTDRHGAEAVAGRLAQAVRDHPWPRISPGLVVTTSVGVAEAAEAATVDALLALADKRLYAAKIAGRDRVVACG